ncbi:Uncharacterised protein [Vibrio cholerae]|nr:Uncharacterised protein [Vibrio cholerae]
MLAQRLRNRHHHNAVIGARFQLNTQLQQGR